jgi:hypothetical protein
MAKAAKSGQQTARLPIVKAKPSSTNQTRERGREPNLRQRRKAQVRQQGAAHDRDAHLDEKDE